MAGSLTSAARMGNVSDLYSLIQGNGNVLRHFDEVEFIDTPLHIAAEEGWTRFAMEMINLKPSFAKKLNQQGLSPLHLAVQIGHKEVAIRFLEIDKDLVRVRGREGKTPLHYVSEVGNQDGLLNRFLEACPDSVLDVTTQNSTALHIAVENRRLDVLQVLLRTLMKTAYHREVVNRKDENGNTALHIAASSNEAQMLKLLLNCKADKHATDQAGLTALGVAQQHGYTESITVLRGCFIPVVSKFIPKLEKQTASYVTKASSLIFRDMDNISGENRNALLVILGLLLTATYQATLSPPGGVWQGGNASKKLGTSVMDPSQFLLFYIPTYAVFIVTFFLTLALLKPFPRGFRTALQVLLAFLAVCFHQSISFIVPSSSASIILSLLSGIVFILMAFMCIAYQVSKFSVSIVGCWILPFHFSGAAIQVLFLLFFLYDKFWKGTIVVVGYCLSFAVYAMVDDKFDPINYIMYPIVSIGSWLVFHLCRFCIKQSTKLCNYFKLQICN